MGNVVQSQIDDQLRKGRIWVGEEEVAIPLAGSEFFGYNAKGITISLGIIGNSTSAKTKITVREDDGYSGGSDLKLNNRNRIAGINPPNLELKAGVTANQTGEVISSFTIFGTAGQGNRLGSVEQSFELPLILRPNTNYTFEVANESAANADYGLLLVLFANPEGLKSTL